MKKKINFIIALIIAAITLYTTNFTEDLPSLDSNPIQNQESSLTSETFDLNLLRETQFFNHHALEHIFQGSINRNGNATGFHFEKTAEDAEIISNTRSKNDRNGVYRANVTVEGIRKNGFSSFFPENWTAQQVVDAINEAYQNKEHVSGNIYEGESKGITIQMYLTENQKIISAFPIYER